MKTTKSVCLAVAIVGLCACGEEASGQVAGTIRPSSGSPVNPSIVLVNPSGACATYQAETYNPITGDKFNCVAVGGDFSFGGVWTRTNGSTTGGAGTVTNSSGPLTANRAVIGNGGADIAVTGFTGIPYMAGGAFGLATGSQVSALFSGTGQCLYSDGTKGACGTGTGGGGATAWGSITGTLSSQGDLQTALNNKQNSIAFPLVQALGGTGTGSPSLIAGANVTITGTWPNQTIASTGGGAGTTYTFTPPIVNTAGTVALANSGATAGTYGNSTNIPQITVDALGRVTAISNVGAAGGGGVTASAISSGILSSIPGTCTAGAVYFATDQPPNSQIYTCSTANTWIQSLLVGGSGGLAKDPVTGALDIVTSVLPRLGAANAFSGSNSFGGTTTLNNVTITGTCTGCSSSGLTNPMTTAEDIIKGGAAGVPTRLAKGSDGQVLSVVSGAVAWAAPTGGTGSVQFKTPYLFDGTNYYVASTGYLATRPNFTGWTYEATLNNSPAPPIAIGTNGSALISNVDTTPTNFTWYGTTAATSIESEFQTSQLCASLSCPANDNLVGIYIRDAGRAYYLAYFKISATVAPPTQPMLRLVFGSFDAGDAGGLQFYGETLPSQATPHLKLGVSGGIVTAFYSSDGGQTFNNAGTHSINTPTRAGVVIAAGNGMTLLSAEVH